LKILFISHYAARTGAPILLLRLIEQIKIYSNLEILILLKNDGALKEDFEKLGKTFIWNSNLKGDTSPGLLKIIKKKLGIRSPTNKEKFKEETLREIKEFLVRVNTVQNVSSVLFRKEFLTKASLSYLKYKSCGEWILYVEILLNSKIAFIEEKINYFRFYHNNISNSSS